MTTTFAERQEALRDTLARVHTDASNRTIDYDPALCTWRGAALLARGLRDVVGRAACLSTLQVVNHQGYTKVQEHTFIKSLALSDDNKISYCKVFNPQFMTEGEYNPQLPKYRVKEKAVKILEVLQRRAPNGMLVDGDLALIAKLPAEQQAKIAERFSELFGVHTAERQFDLELTTEFEEVYAEEYFGSCMHGKPFVNWYEEMGEDVVQLLTVRERGKLVGRALVWMQAEEYGSGKEVKLLDRMYPSDSDNAPHIKAMIKWADANGVVDRKVSQSLHASWVSGNEYVLRDIPWPKNDDEFPYMDSFQWGEGEEGDSLTLYTKNRGVADFVFNQTDGGYEGQNRCYCEDCEDSVNEDEIHTVYTGSGYMRHVCEGCRDNHYVYVDRSVYGNRWARGEYVEGDAVISLRNGDTILAEDAIELANGDLVASDEEGVIQLANGDWVIADEEDLTEVNGEWYYADETVELHNGEYVLKDDATELHDGSYAKSEDPYLVKLHDGEFAILENDDLVEVDGEWYLAGTEPKQKEAHNDAA